MAVDAPTFEEKTDIQKEITETLCSFGGGLIITRRAEAIEGAEWAAS